MCLAAADELDDFVAIAGLHRSLSPRGTREDFEIALDRDAPGIEAHGGEQIRDHGAGTRLALFAIHNNCN